MRLLIFIVVFVVTIPALAEKPDTFAPASTPPTSPVVTAGPAAPRQIQPGTATAEDETAAKAAVEQALGQDVTKYYYDWKVMGQSDYVGFVEYMHYRLNRERRRGINLSAALGGTITLVSVAAFVPMIVLAFDCGYYYYDYGYDSCVEEELLIPGAVLLGTFGTTGIAFVIFGAVKAVRARGIC